MTRPAPRPPRRAPAAREARELCVVLSCHELVCALPAARVERLVLPGEVSLLGRPADPAEGRGWQLVQVGEQLYAGCDLGTQLGLAPVEAAWVLLRAEHRGASLPIALATGPCLVVQPLAAGAALPAAAFRARAGAVAALFPTALLESRADLVEVGLRLDLGALWSEEELDAAAALFGGEPHGRA
jgi:hypothetical protein